MRRTLTLSPALVALACLAPCLSPAAVKLVDSIAALQAAIDETVAGDTLTLKDGIYTTNQVITVNRAGTAGQPITLAAESTGGVEINGTHGFNITGSAAYIVISGFKFTHASGTTVIDEGTSQVRFTRNTFLCTGEGAYLSISGDDAQIDYNEFGAKKSAGNMIAIAGTGSQVARRLWIHHNYFHDLANSGGEGAQMLRLGLMSAHGQSIGAALVEHNLFADCRGVSELISNRSSGNTYRYNTFIDSPTAQLTLRQGNDCVVYGNYFRNTEGVRIYGDRHQLFSNYFEGNHIAIAIGNGAPDPTDGTSNKNARPDDCVIAFNTFVDNTSHYTMSRRTPEALGATNTVFANNIIQGGDSVAKISGPYTGAIWKDNLIWDAKKTGDIPPEGFKLVDAQLVAGSDGIRRPQAGSPALAAATEAYPAVTFDLDGQPRPEKKSIGASEVSAAPGATRILSVTDVGPNASEVKSGSVPEIPATAAPAPEKSPPSEQKTAPSPQAVAIQDKDYASSPPSAAAAAVKRSP
jgi:poly(beta-D-mannuronate) lyase